MEKIQVETWKQLSDLMLSGDLFIKCKNGSQKKAIKKILEDNLGGTAGRSNNETHLYVFNSHGDFDGYPFWDARADEGAISKYIIEEEFLDIYENREDESSTCEPLDISTFL